MTAATEKTTTATKESTSAVKEATVEILTYAEAIRQVQANIAAYVEEQALLTDFGDFFRLARGEFEGFSTAIDFSTPSVVNLKNELDALTTIFNENNVVINENGVVLDEETRRLLRYLATLDALQQSLANVERRTDAHNAALVNPAVSEAVRSLQDYNAVLSDTGVNFETVDSLSDSLTSSIREQASAFDELRHSVERFNQSESQRRQQRGIQTPRLPGETITSDRALGDLDRLFGTDPRSREQDREAQRAAIEAQRESVQLYNDVSDATVDFTSSLIDLQAETNLADRGFQDFLGTFGRLATGDFTALLDIPIQLLNISREAAAGRQQGARDRAALYEDQFGDFSRFGRNFDAVSGVLGIPESPELRDSFFFDQAGEFENVLAQSTADFSDGIKNALLASVINLERELTSEDIQRVISSFHEPIISSLENLAGQAAFNLDFASQSGGDVQGALQDVIFANTALTQAQVDSYNEQRRATGTAVGNVEELNRILNALNNESRLQLDALPPNLFTIASGRRDAQSTAERTGTDRQFTEDIARAQYGGAAFDAEVAAALGITDLDISKPTRSG